MKRYYCLVLLLNWSPALAQGPHLDSLIQAGLSSRPRVFTTKVKSPLVMFNSLDTMRSVSMRLNTIYQLINNGLPTSKQGMGMHYKILNWAVKHKDNDAESVISAELGCNYFLNGNNSEGFKMMFRALSLAKHSGNAQALGTAYCNLGYCSMDNEQAAKNFTFKAIRYCAAARDSLELCYAYENIGDIYLKASRRDSAAFYYERALRIALATHTPNQIVEQIMCFASLAKTATAQLKYYQVARKIALQSQDTVDVVGTGTAIATIYKQTGQIDSSIYYASRAYSLAKKLSLTDEKSPAGILAALYQKLNADSALKYTLIYHAVKDSINDIKQFQRAQAIAYADQQRTAEEEKQKLNYQNRLRLYVLGVIIVFLILLALIFLRNNRRIKLEKKRSDSLLLNILPADVAEELKEKGSANARLFDEVTVLFTDFVNFTAISETLEPQQLVDELDHCFKGFDHIVGKHQLEKIKTIGDAYLAVAGLPNADIRHAQNAVTAASDIIRFIQARKAQLGDKTFDVRVGIHSGSVVAGIVGVKKFAYDIWGDTVNTAARMEQKSEPGKVNISEKTYELIKDEFAFTFRGEIEAKNKGKLKMYFVTVNLHPG